MYVVILEAAEIIGSFCRFQLLVCGHAEDSTLSQNSVRGLFVKVIRQEEFVCAVEIVPAEMSVFGAIVPLAQQKSVAILILL